jgi:dipeptide/tripeptide permease
MNLVNVIVSMVLFEYFNFSKGFKAILALYLVKFLRFSEDTSTMLVHAFIFCSYLSPLFGGLLSDVYIGKYWTVFLLSIVYCIGQSTIAITAIPGTQPNLTLRCHWKSTTLVGCCSWFVACFHWYWWNQTLRCILWRRSIHRETFSKIINFLFCNLLHVHQYRKHIFIIFDTSYNAIRRICCCICNSSCSAASFKSCIHCWI